MPFRGETAKGYVSGLLLRYEQDLITERFGPNAPSNVYLVSVAKRIKAVQMAYFLRFVHAILLDLYVCLLSHVWYEAD